MPSKRVPSDAVEEVRAIRTRIAKRFNNDLHAYVKHLERSTAGKGRKTVNRPMVNVPSTVTRPAKPSRSTK